jgi:hypothetical protein
MAEKLAVFTPLTGVVSETFVRRHVQDLHPAGTVCVSTGWYGDNQ